MAAAAGPSSAGPSSAFESPTFTQTVSIAVDDDIGAASISPAGRDVVLASRGGLRIIDLDDPWSLPLFIPNQSSWEVADVQWSPFAARAEWIASTRNQLALVYNLSMPFNSKKAPIEYTLRAHDRAITDINFSAHHPDLLATCGVDSFVFVHDLRTRQAPLKLADFTAGATQVKWNRQNDNIIASAHDKYLHVWDTRNGAVPLSTIAAHSTKIYGIDWNRNDARKIMTCSLDSTIKLWDNVGVTSHKPKLRRVISTHYPVWRARHTPFANGILAMPQRGNSSLWLYKHVNDCSPSTFTNEAAHEFQGHAPESHVREFLWRTRGSTDDGIDNRDFQLVSWGTDKHLHLHRISKDLLKSSVEHKKGESRLDGPTSTRRGAAYITYRNGPVQTTTSAIKDDFGPPRSQKKGNLSALLQNYAFSDDKNSRQAGSRTHSYAPTRTLSRQTMNAVPIRRADPRVVTHITWMDGVKFSSKQTANDGRPRTNSSDRGSKNPFQDQNDLGAEISLVGNKYKKLTFDKIDVPGRCITVSFNGPWGDFDATTEELKLVFLRFTIRFPLDYPKATDGIHPATGSVRTAKPLQIECERTTASITKENQDELLRNMLHIADSCADHEREALEAVLSYALGERGLDDSLQFPDDEQALEDLDPIADAESSSDDDEHDGEFTNDAMQSSHTNTNVPTPNQNAVRFSASGSLVVARLPPVKSGPALESIQLRIARTLRHGPGKDDIFDSFGHFIHQRADDSDGDSSADSSTGSWEESSSGSTESESESDCGVTAIVGKFQPPMAWQKAAMRFQSRHSLPSSSGTGKQPLKTRSIVSILSSAVEDLVPSKRELAEEYRIFGSGPELCEHNAIVARKYGFEDLADIWMLCKLILSNRVPLEILPQQHRREQVLVLARRALVRIKRKDSGLDLQFDEAENVTNPKLTGRVKWGNHAIATWLVPAIFDHFERLADVQMLAMLSCIFAEPAAREGVTSAMANMRHSHLPMSMEAPAFSLDYYSSIDAAWSLFRPTIAMPSTPAHSRHAVPVNDFGWQKLAKNLGTYGSHGSSNGLWGSDTIPSEPVTPYSTGHTPPIFSRGSTIRTAHTTTHTPYSTSPEQSHTGIKRSSTAHFASAVAALSRPFANTISSSPPVKSRIEDLSSSAPTGAVQWGPTTVYGENHDRRSLAPSRDKHRKRASFGQDEPLDANYLHDSDSDYEKLDEEDDFVQDHYSVSTRPVTPGENGATSGPGPIRVTLKNQDQFDDEACLSRPLLDMSKDWLHRAWRRQYAEMLGCWNLVSARAEVLKFNGLVSYFTPSNQQSQSRAGSLSLTLTRKKDAISETKTSRQLSQASSTLIPPSPRHHPSKLSPIATPSGFSFNPEALEFQPRTSVFVPAESFGSVPDIAISEENHLRLAIPAPTPTKELDESFAGLGFQANSKLHAQSTKPRRPSLSRGVSIVSATSSWGGGRSPNAVPITSNTKKGESTYSCSICWIRVSGRFFICPTCCHVAHFDCMDDELCADDGECIVGCACGCGLEEQEERTRMEAYIDEVRAANAAGIAWDDSVDWHQMAVNSEPTTPAPVPWNNGSLYGDFMTGVVSKMGGAREKFAGQTQGTPGSGTTSPTLGMKRKEKKDKGKKRARVSGLSYY